MDRIDLHPAADERTTIDEFLDYQRATLLGKTEGLGAEGLNRRIPTSSLTLGGLLKHLGLPDLEPWASAPGAEDRDWEFHSAEHDAPEALRELYRAACERSRQALAGADLSDLSAGTDRDGRHWTLRWILTHLIEETARHCGHADLLREAVDGTVGE